MKEFTQYGICFLLSAFGNLQMSAASEIQTDISQAEAKKFISARGQKIKVIDGDSLLIGKTEIRLEGIDAPEYFQECYDAEDFPYPCGKKARKALEKMVSPDLKCEKITKDKYNRVVAICYNGDRNINREMVAQGQAVAYKRYTHDFDQDEKNAQKFKKGIWQGRFLKPEFYRILKNQKKNQK